MAGPTTLRTFLITDFGDSERWRPLACAVTAYDENDALELVRVVYPPDGDQPPRDSIEELTPEAIQNRIGHFDFGIPVVRGVWFPHLTNP
jgi:hypothetical protein